MDERQLRHLLHKAIDDQADALDLHPLNAKSGELFFSLRVNPGMKVGKLTLIGHRCAKGEGEE